MKEVYKDQLAAGGDEDALKKRMKEMEDKLRREQAEKERELEEKRR